MTLSCTCESKKKHCPSESGDIFNNTSKTSGVMASECLTALKVSLNNISYESQENWFNKGFFYFLLRNKTKTFFFFSLVFCRCCRFFIKKCISFSETYSCKSDFHYHLMFPRFKNSFCQYSACKDLCCLVVIQKKEHISILKRFIVVKRLFFNFLQLTSTNLTNSPFFLFYLPFLYPPLPAPVPLTPYSISFSSSFSSLPLLLLPLQPPLSFLLLPFPPLFQLLFISFPFLLLLFLFLLFHHLLYLYLSPLPLPVPLPLVSPHFFLPFFSSFLFLISFSTSYPLWVSYTSSFFSSPSFPSSHFLYILLFLLFFVLSFLLFLFILFLLFYFPFLFLPFFLSKFLLNSPCY